MSTRDLSHAHPLVREAMDPDGRSIIDIVSDLSRVMKDGGLSVRESQLRMSELVAEGCEDSAWVAVHAPCGTGKSLAYLLAGLLYRERERALSEGGKVGPIVISTSNISLQSQLLSKDVPLASRLLGIHFTAAVLKGRGNYLCPRNIEHERTSLIGPRIGYTQDVERLITWYDRGGSGDKEDVTFPYDGRAWADLSRDGQACIGKACPVREQCPSEIAKARMSRVDVVITNHSYLAVGTLPEDACLLVVDEAHALEGALLNAHSKRLTPARARKVAGKVAHLLMVTDAQMEKVLVHPVEMLLKRAEAGLIPGERGDDLLPAGWCGALPAEGKGYADRLYTQVEITVEEMDAGPDKEEAVKVLADVGRLRHLFLLIREGTRILGLNPDHPLGEIPSVVWVHREPERDASLHAAYPDVTPMVRQLRSRFPCVVFCSATLASAGRLDDFATSLGMEKDSDSPPPEIQAVLSSPFDLPRQALAVIPHGPSPKSGPAWKAWRNDRVVEAVRASGGGALVLSSSWSGAREIAEVLRRADIQTASGRLSSYRVQLQGEQSRKVQIERFAEDRDGVLVGTRSLFEGVDIPGDSCRLVIVDRIPFGSPDDPLEKAVVALMEDRYKSSGFMLRTLPAALRTLEQAAGRLIRTAQDRGAFLLLDSRALQPGPIWGKVLHALRPMTTSHRVSEIRDWMEQE